MLRRTLLTVVTVLALAGVAAAQSGNFIVTLKNADAIWHIETRYKAEVLGQVGDAPVFLIHVEGKNAARQLLRDRLVLDVEEDRIVTLDGKGISSNGNAAAKSLSEKGKKGKKSKKSGKKNRSGDDPTEGSGEDPVLNQSTMALFWQALGNLGLDQSTMFLFWERLTTADLDQSTMALFWELTEKMYLDQSTMALFKDDGKLWDSFGHGTLVAGLLHVVAPEARLVPIRAFDAQGQSTLFLTMAAVYAAIGRDVDVINMSFSIGEDSKAFSRVLNLAWSRGISLVASVGNNGEDAGEVYPAAYPIVIGVTATDLDDRIADFANYGRSVSVAAPGVGVVTTFPGGLYARASGTSFSAPIVAGGVALLMSTGERNRNAGRAIITTADSIDDLNPEWTKRLGWGRINLLNALEGRD